VLVLRLGRRFYGPNTAATAALALTTTYLFWDKARWVQIDSTLCFFIWLALAAFVSWRAGDARGRRAVLLLWLATAFAVLAKGPIGLLLVLGIVAVTLFTDRRLRDLKSFAPVSGPLAFMAVVCTWMLIATVGGGGEYSVWGAVKEHVIDRGIHGMHHKQPFWYFAANLPVLLFPWSLLAPGAVVLAWRRRRSEMDRFLLIVVVFVFLFFSLSSEKRGLYVLPAMPAFALLIAHLFAEVDRRKSDQNDAAPKPCIDRRWVSVAQTSTGALLVLIGCYVPFVAERYENVPVHIVYLLAGAFVMTGLAVLIWILRHRTSSSAFPLAAGIGLVYLIVVALVYPSFEPVKSARAFALILKEKTQESRNQGHQVLGYTLDNLPVSIAFYSNGVYIKHTEEPDVLEEHLRQDAQVFAAINSTGMDELNDEVRERVVVLHSTRLSRRDVLLIANRE
jgi:4-amino-4-deoxy-L-arabinose transferase-like glycosyltransferase